jgi:FkbM family methyltransferase
MDGSRIKQAIRPVYDPLFDTIVYQRRKPELRGRLMELPLTPDYPFPVEAKLLRAVGVGPAMLDVGANTGIFSALLEDVVGAGNLYLFEPLPHLCARLRRRFRRAHVYNLALSNETGTRTMRVPYIRGKRVDYRATLGAHTEPDQSGSDEISVRVAPLDTLVADLALDSVGFVKIDVEGHEDAVLDGATRTIDRYQPLLLVEIEARHHTFPITEIFARLEDRGYRGYYLDPSTFTFPGVADFDVQRHQREDDLVARRFVRYLNNFVFVPQARERDFVAKAEKFLEAEKQLVAESSSG